VGECDCVITEFTHVPALRDAIQNRDRLQNEFSAFQASKRFAASVQVGKALLNAKEAVALQPLSEKDFLTLAERHAALLQKMTVACEERHAALLQKMTVACEEVHAKADHEALDALYILASKLQELTAVDLSVLQQPAYKGAAPPPAPLAPLASTATSREEELTNVPPAPAAPQSTSAEISVTAGVGNEDWVNDPVHVRPTPDASKCTNIEVLRPSADASILVAAGEDDGANDPVYVPPGRSGTSDCEKVQC
jgi:hypothetical protein